MTWWRMKLSSSYSEFIWMRRYSVDKWWHMIGWWFVDCVYLNNPRTSESKKEVYARFPDLFQERSLSSGMWYFPCRLTHTTVTELHPVHIHSSNLTQHFEELISKHCLVSLNSTQRPALCCFYGQCVDWLVHSVSGTLSVDQRSLSHKRS